MVFDNELKSHMKIQRSPVKANTWANIKTSITLVLIYNSSFILSTGFKRQMHKTNYKSMLVDLQDIKIQNHDLWDRNPLGFSFVFYHNKK